MGMHSSVFPIESHLCIRMQEKDKNFVLLCDDDDLTAQLFSEQLKKEHFTVVRERSGEVAQETIYSHKPDVVILDFILQEKTGFEVLEHIYHHDQDLFFKIPFIVFTNFAQEGQICSAYSLNAIKFVVKAKTTPGDLSLIVRESLMRKFKCTITP